MTFILTDEQARETVSTFDYHQQSFMLFNKRISRLILLIGPEYLVSSNKSLLQMHLAVGRPAVIFSTSSYYER